MLVCPQGPSLLQLQGNLGWGPQQPLDKTPSSAFSTHCVVSPPHNFFLFYQWLLYTPALAMLENLPLWWSPEVSGCSWSCLCLDLGPVTCQVGLHGTRWSPGLLSLWTTHDLNLQINHWNSSLSEAKMCVLWSFWGMIRETDRKWPCSKIWTPKSLLGNVKPPFPSLPEHFFFLVPGIKEYEEGREEAGVLLGISKHCAACRNGCNSDEHQVYAHPCWGWDHRCKPQTLHSWVGQRQAFLILGPATLHQWHSWGELQQPLACLGSHVTASPAASGAEAQGSGARSESRVPLQPHAWPRLPWDGSGGPASGSPVCDRAPCWPRSENPMRHGAETVSTTQTMRKSLGADGFKWAVRKYRSLNVSG